MHDLIHLGKCLADPTSVRLIACLLITDMLLPDMQRALKIKIAALRPKLRMLRDCGLVEVEGDGRWLRYRVAEGRRELIDCIFSKYEDEIAWDPAITEASQFLESQIRPRRM